MGLSGETGRPGDRRAAGSSVSPTANLAVEGITDRPNRESQTARKPACTPGFLAKSITCSGQIIAIDQSLPHSSRTTRDLVYSGAPTPTSEPEVEIAPLVQKVGAISIAEIENMIGELQAAKDFLESEGERVQREAEHYTTLTQMASASVKIISDTVAGWRQAGHPVRDHSRSPQFDLTLAPAEDNTSSSRLPDQH